MLLGWGRGHDSGSLQRQDPVLVVAQLGEHRAVVLAAARRRGAHRVLGSREARGRPHQRARAASPVIDLHQQIAFLRERSGQCLDDRNHRCTGDTGFRELFEHALAR